MIALIPLVLIVYYLLSKGLGSWSWSFFTTDPTGNTFFKSSSIGGIKSAILGTIEIVALASADRDSDRASASRSGWSSTAASSWFANVVRFFVDVLTGVPSIIFGLFVYIVLIVGTGSSYAGYKGSIALSLLMLPIVIRSAEVILLLVPGGLRESALALGAPRWRVIFSIVLPTALPGMVTGMLLAIARAAGETAPLLFTAAATHNTNFNLGQFMNSLPVQIYSDVTSPTTAVVEQGLGSRAHAGLHDPGAQPDRPSHLAKESPCMTRNRSTQELADMDPDSSSEIERREQGPTDVSGDPVRAHIVDPASKPAMSGGERAATSIEPKPGLNVKLEQLRAFYGEAEQVKGIDLDFHANEVTAIIGPSGCGKSTMVRCINRMHEEIPGARAEGRVMLSDMDVYDPSIDVVAVRRAVGMVFQKPNPFPTMSIFDNVAAGLRLSSRGRGDLRGKVEAALRGASLWSEVADRLDQPGAGLSGGQQQRLCIARSLAVDPEVLLMDEPCSALDPVATLKIEELIEELKRRVTIVIVTHNMQQAARVADRTAFMLDGKLVEVGPTQEIFTKPSDPRTEEYVTGKFG